MNADEVRWAKWADLRARQAEATTLLEQLALRREENELRREGIEELLAEDVKHEPGWFWLSFADESGFLGACIVRGAGMMEATIIARGLGCNPGGEVLGEELENLPPDEYRERLLSREDIDEMQGIEGLWRPIT